MFSPSSRYRQVPDVAVLDARGRVLAAKDLRPLPEVTGTFRHTVNAGDRLVQLGYSYYGRPLDYWHICDGNPQFLSPLALLDQESVGTSRFPVSVPTGNPPWAAVLRALSSTVGVQEVTVEEEIDLVEQRQTVSGQSVTVVVKQFNRALLVTHNQLTVDPVALTAVIAAAGFTVGTPVHRGQLGRPIVIPPAVNG